MQIMKAKAWFFLLFISCFFIVQVSRADEGLNLPDGEAEKDTTWVIGGFFRQQLNQVSFSNWAQGGENSFASTTILNFSANYKKDKLSWENRLNTAFGLLKTEDEPLRKNEDRIHYITKAGREISPNLSTSFLGDFRTQFYKGYNYPNDSVVVSRFMAPGTLALSLGIDYRPFTFLSVFVSPASGKFTFVRDQELANKGAFGVSPAEYDQEGQLIREGKNVNSEFGVLLSLFLNKEVFEDVYVESRLTLFNNLVDDERSNRKNTDLDWETNINMKINRYITASAFFHMIYDHDILLPLTNDAGEEIGKTRKLQLKQILGIGLSYRLSASR